jgi:hypothetical protein
MDFLYIDSSIIKSTSKNLLVVKTSSENPNDEGVGLEKVNE